MEGLNLEQFRRFGKNSLKLNSHQTKNAVIYTRVSSRKQEDGYSLEIQLEATEAYAKKNGLTVIGLFGGKYESAQTDQERKEFNRMLSFAKNSKDKVSYVLVYTVDRFSRTGINGAFIKESLRQEGIELIAVNQPADTSNPGGRLQQNIQFIFSEYDNDLRREKCVGGMREKLLKGYWTGRVPLGYDMINKNKEQIITINKKGELIRQAFIWKAEGMPQVEIIKRLQARGLKIYQQMLQWIFNNPFYCGLMVHTVLGGEVVEGKHPPLISKELFLKVHGIGQKNRVSKHHKEFPYTPLKHFLKCNDCKKPFAGYIVKKKGLYYYKCVTIGCRCNKRAEYLNNMFTELLDFYSIDVRYMEPLKVKLREVFYKMNQSNRENAVLIKEKLTELEKNIETLEERFAFGKISDELYHKFIGKLKAERLETQQKLTEVDFELSNLSELIEKALTLSSKWASTWTSGNYSDKEEIQKLLFPEGIYYDRKNDTFRTEKINPVFSSIRLLSSSLKEGGMQKAGEKSRFSNWVGATGFEPVTPCL